MGIAKGTLVALRTRGLPPSKPSVCRPRFGMHDRHDPGEVEERHSASGGWQVAKELRAKPSGL